MRHVAIVCDIGSRVGSGHAMRCLALAEELLPRGVAVTYASDVSAVPWVHDRILASGVEIGDAVREPGDLAAIGTTLDVDGVIVDSYTLGADAHAALRSSGLPVLAVVDHDLRGAVADLYLDQNIGSEEDAVALRRGTRLAGLKYALMRDEILQRRPAGAPTARDVATPRVFGIFGGTDPAGAGPLVAQALADTGRAFDATIVTARPELVSEIGAVRLRPDQSLTTIGPTDRLADHVVASDMVVSAAGSSAWELLCLGAATGLVCVADNQAVGYARAGARGVGVGLGHADRGPDFVAAAVEPLRAMLTDAGLRSRSAQAGWRLVDGRGRQRVADAFTALG